MMAHHLGTMQQQCNNLDLTNIGTYTWIKTNQREKSLLTISIDQSNTNLQQI